VQWQIAQTAQSARVSDQRSEYIYFQHSFGPQSGVSLEICGRVLPSKSFARLLNDGHGIAEQVFGNTPARKASPLDSIQALRD
jgi:hypothetical protein